MVDQLLEMRSHGFIFVYKVCICIVVHIAISYTNTMKGGDFGHIKEIFYGFMICTLSAIAIKSSTLKNPEMLNAVFSVVIHIIAVAAPCSVTQPTKAALASASTVIHTPPAMRIASTIDAMRLAA